MPTAPITAPATGDTGDAAALTVDEQFLDLICSDADLVAAEFEAIIAAEWPDPPTRRPGRGITGGQSGSGRARGTGDPVPGPGSPPRQPEIHRWARQRSPPPTLRPRETDETEKGR